VLPAKRSHGDLVSARSTSQAKVDAIGVQLRKRPKRFGNDQWRMVGQHDSTRTHTDSLRSTRNISNEHGGGRTCYPLHIVVFRQPVPFKAEVFSVLCGLEGYR